MCLRGSEREAGREYSQEIWITKHLGVSVVRADIVRGKERNGEEKKFKL